MARPAVYAERVALRADGGLDGLVGGGIPVTESTADVMGLGIPPEPMSAFGTALRAFADLSPVEGRCAQVSAGVTFEARLAFVNP